MRLVLSSALLLVWPTMLSTTAEAQSAWELAASGAELSFANGDEEIAVETPSEGRSEWQRLRTTFGWDPSSIAYGGRPLQSTLTGALELHEAGLIQFESGLIAAHYRLGNIPLEQAAAWVQLLNHADELTPDELKRRLFLRRQYDRGSALAVLNPACVPLDVATLEAAEALAIRETSIPARRTLDTTIETAVNEEARAALSRSAHASFVDAVARALNGASFSGAVWIPPEGDAIASADQPSMNPAGESQPTVQVFGETTDSEEPESEPCNADRVALFAELGLLTVSSGEELEARIREAAAETDVPSKLLWRAAVHQYLQANQAMLALIAELYEQELPASTAGQRFMRALVDLADGVVHDPQSSWPRRSDATNTTWLWIYTEHLRTRRQLEEAATLAAILLDQDAQFLGSWLTQAAIALRRGDLALAHRNMMYLRTTAPPASIYQHWASLLEVQLQELGEATGPPEFEVQ